MPASVDPRLAAATLAAMPEQDAARLLSAARAMRRAEDLRRRDWALGVVLAEHLPGRSPHAAAREIACAWTGRRTPRDDSPVAVADARLRPLIRAHLIELLGGEAYIPAERQLRRIIATLAIDRAGDGQCGSTGSGQHTPEAEG